MRKKYFDKGLKIIISKKNPLLERIKIRAHIKKEFYGGGDNTVYVGENVEIGNAAIHILGSNNRIIIGDNCSLGNCVLRADGDNNLIVIGHGTSIGGAYIHAMDSTSIEIGRKCMLSSEIDIRSGEHCIYNMDDGRRYNFSQNIKIGNHVWIGKRAQCLKGVEIADYSVVGASALVTKKFSESNVIIAGHPAKIIKKGINWRR